MILLEENTVRMIFALVLAIIFLELSPLDKGNKSKNKQMGHHQTKNLLHKKENISEVKRQPSEWEKIAANDIFHKR